MVHTHAPHIVAFNTLFCSKSILPAKIRHRAFSYCAIGTRHVFLQTPSQTHEHMNTYTHLETYHFSLRFEAARKLSGSICIICLQIVAYEMVLLLRILPLSETKRERESYRACSNDHQIMHHRRAIVTIDYHMKKYIYYILELLGDEQDAAFLCPARTMAD